MQGTYTHMPETNYVPREYGVAAILLFLFMVLISLLAVLNLLYFYISTFRSMCAVYYYYYYYYYYLYAECLQLHTQNKPCHYGMQCCSCSVFTDCATCNVITHVKPGR